VSKITHPLQDRREKHVSVSENWYPTVDGRVRVIFTRLNNGRWRVAVWGGDDYGLEVDLKSRMDALMLYKGIEDGITQAKLKEMGLGPA
jgi:hypothetical protein